MSTAIITTQDALRKAGQAIPDICTPLILLIFGIHYLPYIARKHLLDCVRIQRSQYSDRHLRDSRSHVLSLHPRINAPRRILNLFNRFMVHDREFLGSQHYVLMTFIHTAHLLDLFEHIYDSPILCSVLSYFVRAETTAHPKSFEDISENQQAKEIAASQQLNIDEQLSYLALFTDGLAPIHRERDIVPRLTSYMFTSHMRSLIDEYTDERFILFPHYNRKKNVSYKTQENYWMHQEHDPDYTRNLRLIKAFV